MNEMSIRHHFQVGSISNIEPTWKWSIYVNFADFICAVPASEASPSPSVQLLRSAWFAGGWGLILPLWCLSTHQVCIEPPKNSQNKSKIHCWPLLVFPQIPCVSSVVQEGRPVKTRSIGSNIPMDIDNSCLGVHPWVFDYHDDDFSIIVDDLTFVPLHRRFVCCPLNNPTLYL